MLILILKNWAFRKMLRTQFEEEGFNVMDFEDADILTMEMFSGVNVSLVILDLMDGGYTIPKLKELKNKAGDAPFLLLKGAYGLSDTQLRQEGFNLILRRPFSIGELVEEVKNVLNKGSR
jgi:DNA-binding response OmpR family regulator